MSRTPELDNLTPAQAAKLKRIYGRAALILGAIDGFISVGFPVALIAGWRPAWPQTVGIVLLWLAVGFFAVVASQAVKVIDAKSDVSA